MAARHAVRGGRRNRVARPGPGPEARLAPGLTARSALEKFAAVQMIDVHIPTTDGRVLQLTRYTQPEADLRMWLDRLKMDLPDQPPPKITAAQATPALSL